MANVLVTRNMILPLSETFIATQIDAMDRFQPVVLCHRRINADVFPMVDVTQLNEHGTLQEKVDSGRYVLGFWSKRFDKRVAETNPVLIHAHGGSEGTLAVHAKRKHNLPLVTTFHGFDATGTDRPLGMKGRLIAAAQSIHKSSLKKHGDLFVAVSEEIKSHLIKQGFPAEKVKVIHLGINLDALDSVPSGNQERATNIITVGRLVEKKGTTDLIAAFARLSQVYPEFRLDIVGDGPLRSAVIDAIDHHNLGDRVTLHGALPFSEVHQLIAKSRIFCLPSKRAENGDKEGLPIAILEAMALGTPVVSTWHSGIPEAVIDGRTGLLVKEGEVESLADSLIQLAGSHQMWSSFAAEARERIVNDFDTRKQTAALEREFDRLTNR